MLSNAEGKGPSSALQHSGRPGEGTEGRLSDYRSEERERLALLACWDLRRLNRSRVSCLVGSETVMVRQSGGMKMMDGKGWMKADLKHQRRIKVLWSHAISLQCTHGRCNQRRKIDSSRADLLSLSSLLSHVACSFSFIHSSSPLVHSVMSASNNRTVCANCLVLLAGEAPFYIPNKAVPPPTPLSNTICKILDCLEPDGR